MKYHIVITLVDLKNAFNNNSIEGKYLNKSKFNDTIMTLLNFNTPSLHYTYLSEKLYEMLDESGDGKIQEDEYLLGMKKVLSNKEFRIRCNNIIIKYVYIFFICNIIDAALVAFFLMHITLFECSKEMLTTNWVNFYEQCLYFVVSI